MPKEGYDSLTLKAELIQKLKDTAKRHKRTPSQQLDFMLRFY